MKVRRRPALLLGSMVVVVGLLLWAGRSWLRRERRAAARPSLRVHEPSLRHCLEVHAPPAAGLTGSDTRARKRVAAPWLDGLRALATLGLTATLLLARETTGSTIAYFTASKNVQGSLGAASQNALTGLTATESDEAASLAWTAPAGGWATAYRVYRGSTSGGPYTLLSSGGCAAPVSGTSCTDGTVGAGTYYYVVRGLSGRGGSGVDSNQASVTIGGEGLLYYPQASLVEEELPAPVATPSST
ncbi:MAG TPA: hypothetical protein VER55_10135, partial [Ardenticatenaceae bacterium]|nr:hypothetical protein [Ardenticatenaceae bacterium]